jgi:NAD(P)-dependent dehydrogenase (short-subunit alcohol dehydrogenase family)
MSKVALVTGSSRGIGKGIALSLAKAGYDVGVHYSSTKEGALDTVQKIEALGQKAIAFQADISKLEDIKILFESFSREFSRLDLLVNNAGITRMKSFLEIDEEMFSEVINTDLRGTFFCAQTAAKLMIAGAIPGCIINISSNHSVGCWPGSTVYASAKAGVDKLGKNMAMELSKYRIRVVTIAPGYTFIPENNRPRPAEGPVLRIPLGRFAEVNEVGAACVFLASENAGYITGTTLFMDGGSLLPVLAHHDF